ncbi:hypothetical protein OROHE_020509 [Orobanche hederae]
MNPAIQRNGEASFFFFPEPNICLSDVKNYTVENGGSNCNMKFKDLGELVSIIDKGILGKLSSTSESSLETAKSRVMKNISCIINRISRMSWADLPVDILFVIFGFLYDMNNLKFLDLYQCLAVCRSWRLVAKQIWQTRILPTTPWLLFHIDRSNKIVLKTNLYKCHESPPSLATKDNDVSFSSTLNLFHFQTYASYDGWLLVGNSVDQPFLYNPVTELLQLPPLPPYYTLSLFMKFVSSGASPTDHNCIICIKFSSRREHMEYDDTYLAFCRPSVSTSWVELKEEAEDVIFSGGKFYTIGSGGNLFVYNGYKSNSIYFYDEEHWGQTTTYGIYDLGTRKINHKTEDADCQYPKLFTPSKISSV